MTTPLQEQVAASWCKNPRQDMEPSAVEPVEYAANGRSDAMNIQWDKVTFVKAICLAAFLVALGANLSGYVGAYQVFAIICVWCTGYLVGRFQGRWDLFRADLTKEESFWRLPR
jgi:hypothetical protein